MTRIPQNFIDDLLNRIDIIEIIDVRVTLRKMGSNYSARCPFHNEKTPSFTVSPTKQFYYCFGCRAHGNAIGFLMQYEHLEFVEAVETLAAKVGVELPVEMEQQQQKQVAQQDFYTLLQQASRYYQVQLRRSTIAIDYLKSRGISGEIAKHFGIGFAPDAWDDLKKYLATNATLEEQLISAGMLIKKNYNTCYDRFRARIMFPIRDLRGRVIAFGGRSLGAELPKYLNSPETPVFHKSHELYGLYEARRASSKLERLLIVEGYMDVIALVQHGITYAVATLGTATSSQHLQRLFRYTTEIIFCFDGDQAGQTAAWRALEISLPLMRDGLQILFMFLPEGEDPDSLIRKEGQPTFQQRITAASSLSDFFFKQLQQQINLETADGKARFFQLAMQLLQDLPKGVFQQLMYERLAAMIGVDANRLEELSQRQDKARAQQETIAPAVSGNRPSLVAFAITLLLQHPALATNVTELDMAGLRKTKLPGLDVLLKLLEVLHSHPHATTGVLLEYWRDHKQADYLAKLAAHELTLAPEALPAEFQDALLRIQAEAHEQLLQSMLAKAKTAGLSDAERQQLQQLLMVGKLSTE